MPALAALLGVVVAGCSQQGEATATEPTWSATTAPSDAQAAPTLIDTFRIGGSVTLGPGKSEVLGKFGGPLDLTECHGSDDYPDLIYGARVKVTDSQGKVAGEHYLGTGVYDKDTGKCVMRFGVQAKGGSQTYRVQIGSRQPFDVSYEIASTLGAHASID